MSILVNNNTRLLVQGITGNEGKFHTERMLSYGTVIPAGVTPGKGGETELGIPVYDSVQDAVSKHKINASVIFVPSLFAADAICEAIESNIPLVICITEGIPVLDMIKVKNLLKNSSTRLIGPNCPGIITPSEAKIGIMPGEIHKAGNIGIISRSGTLTYEVVDQLTKQGIGQSTCVGIGGDPIPGSSFVDILKEFNKDEKTKGVILIGEIGGSAEEEAADYIKSEFTKPVIAFIAGISAPPGKRMGHAGAIISKGSGTAIDKIKYLQKKGITVIENPASIGEEALKIF